MAKRTDTQRYSAARRLAILGALVMGAAGVIMAVFAVVTGEEMGGGALLAASALAFGLLAINVDRTIGQRALNPSPALLKPRGDSSEGNLPGSEKVAPPDVDPITEREREVLSFVAEGYSNKLISVQLGISERTVKNHLTATMNKLRASDRTHAVVKAFRLGWLDIEQGPPQTRSDGRG